ncbi:FixH family protein [Virgibacillus byunsanensis]|uniref:FixH family protein n=1 Tax=Virgibacillus byunsanensis TaxID=570945 RepID=A0ABW3LKE1_9BACI
MKNISYLFLFIIIVVLSACGQEEDSSSGNNEDAVQAIDVQLEAPEQVNADELTVFSATVTQADNPVEDADEVDFEIWKDTEKDESEMIEAKHEGNGVYAIEKAFSKEGIYMVQSHVTARGMHAMPQKEVRVGDVEPSAEAESEHDDDSDHSDSHVSIQLHQPENITVGDSYDLTVELQHEDQALESATISLEIWHEGAEEHNWIEANENSPGQYVAEVTFDERVDYVVNVHVKKEDIHDHKEFTFHVN